MNEINDSHARKAEQPETQLTLSSLVVSEHKASATEDFGRSFVHSLIQSPLEGAAQLIDGKANGSAQKSVHFIDSAKPAEFGSANWLAQQAGSGLGAVLPVLLIHRGISSAMELNYSAKAGLAMADNMEALTARQALAAGTLKIGATGLTGMVYSGVFTPVKNDDANFWQARAHNTAVGGLTFSTLAASGLGLKSLSQRTSSAMPAISKVFGSEIGSGVISGIPAGLVSTNADSLLSRKGFASADQQIQSAVTFAIMGGGFAYGKSRISEFRPAERASESTGSFKAAGLDVDGRPLAESQRAAVTANLPEYSRSETASARTQTLKELSEIKALEPGKSVLDQFRDSNLSIGEKYRVLNSLAQVREHFVNQRANGRIEPDQAGNWIHTQGEFGRVINAAEGGKATPADTHDALLASMFSDAVKTKANFFTHHMEGALAADHVLSNEFGAGFGRARLDGIVNGIREHQIGPPEFMSNLYATRIRSALQFKLSPEQEASLASLQKKIANPLDPQNETYRTADGATALRLTGDEKALLELTGAREWYVPQATNPWNHVSRAVIDGDSVDNYFTPGGIGKITGLGGPESDKWFMTKRIDNEALQPERASNIGSARMSGVDASKIITPESKPLAQQSLAQTEAAIAAAKHNVANWLRSEKGIDPDKQAVPYFNTDLKYPEFGENDGKWWNIHRTAADKRTPEDQAFYDAHRFDGLSPQEQADFLLAKEVRNRVVDQLRAAQRLDGMQPPQYVPSTGQAGK